MRLRTVVLYSLAFAAAIVVDVVTPLGVADWLIEVILAWVASVRGGSNEMVLIGGVGTGAVALGLLTSPDLAEPLWIAILNRSCAVGIIWMLVVVGRRRRAAETARNAAAAQLRVLQGLLPICAACKSIRDESGEWHPLETYLSAYSEARLTHSLCPPCAGKYMADVNDGGRQ